MRLAPQTIFVCKLTNKNSFVNKPNKNLPFVTHHKHVIRKEREATKKDLPRSHPYFPDGLLRKGSLDRLR